MQIFSSFAVHKFIYEIDWLPIWLGIGIILYFWLPFNPTITMVYSAIVLQLLCLVVLWKMRFLAYPVKKSLFICVFVALGFVVSAAQVARMDAPALPADIDVITMQARVAEVSLDEGKYRVLFDELSIDELEQDKTPPTLRLSYRGKTPPELGGLVTARAKVFSPSGPAMPGSFDFARYFFFRQIGGVGVVFPPLKPVNLDVNNGQNPFPLPEGEGSGSKAVAGEISFWQNWRYIIQQKFMDKLSSPISAIAIALSTGDKTAISDEVRENFQAASLSHMLAISGMHMAIICGIFYAVLRSILSIIPFVYYRINVKKLSAFLALIATGIYLCLAGFPVSAVRAYIMISFMLSAVLVDREAFTVRSLAIAAFAILLVQPSNIMEAGFQLSFAATLALVVCYRWFSRKNSKNQGFVSSAKDFKTLYKMKKYFLGIVISSLIASLATLPFVAYHFQQIAPYGIIANLFAVPILGLIVMPAVILTLVLMPFGLEHISLGLVEFGIDNIYKVAVYVAEIEGSLIHISPIAPYVMMVMVIGLILLLLHRSLNWKYAGVVMVASGMVASLFYIQPDILISADGKHVAVKDDEYGWVLVKGKSTRNFLMRQWQERLGEEFTMLKKLKKEEKYPKSLKCDWSGCVYKKDGNVIAITKRQEALAEDCLLSDIVIAADMEHATNNNLCVVEKPENDSHTAQLIDKSSLKTLGSTAIWLNKTMIQQKSSCEGLTDRPWANYCR